jgi:soluble lytic murein transglycosylase-like protein
MMVALFHRTTRIVIGTLLAAGFPFVASAAERAVLVDGRHLLCQSREATPGGWVVTLPEGGTTVLPKHLVARFEAVPDAPEGFQPVEARAEAVPDPVRGAPGDPKATGIMELVGRVATEYSVDPKLVEAVIQVESGFDPFAVSPKGAAGLMQLMPETAKRFDVSDVFDPVENVRGGVRYLRFLTERFEGDLGLVLAAYNAGEGSVDRYMGVPPYRETRLYVVKVLERYLEPEPREM